MSPLSSLLAFSPEVAAAGVIVLLGIMVWLLVRHRENLQRLRDLEESETRFRLLFERSPDASMIFDTRTGKFTHCNEASLRLQGATREWIIGKHPWEISPPLQADGKPSFQRAQELIEQMNQEGSVRFEWIHGRADGTSFPAEITITAIDTSEYPLRMAIVRDMTEWKRAQRMAAEANQTLERRVEERTAELARTNEQLQLAEHDLRNALTAERELNELKSNFVSMVSHEFRTPLGIISSSAQILDLYFPRLNEGDRREHVEAITTSVRRMAAMMENVLLLSRMDRSRMGFSPAPLELEPFCHRLLDELHSSTSAAQHIRLELAPEVPRIIQADEGLLRHIFGNLLSNAVKYSPPEEAPLLRIGSGPDGLRFEVVDRGIGIPEEDQANLFATFHRGANVGQRPGTGLGLIIVKRCCELHGGTVLFTSACGRGSTFTVLLPLLPTP